MRDKEKPSWYISQPKRGRNRKRKVITFTWEKNPWGRIKHIKRMMPGFFMNLWGGTGEFDRLQRKQVDVCSFTVETSRFTYKGLCCGRICGTEEITYILMHKMLDTSKKIEYWEYQQANWTKAHSTERNNSWYWKSSQIPGTSKITDLRKESSTTTLLHFK